MVFMCLPHGKWFLETCQSHGIWVLGVATKKMVFRGLPNGKCVLRVRQKESGFQEVVTKKIVFRGLPH